MAGRLHGRRQPCTGHDAAFPGFGAVVLVGQILKPLVWHIAGLLPIILSNDDGYTQQDNAMLRRLIPPLGGLLAARLEEHDSPSPDLKHRPEASAQRLCAGMGPAG